MAKCFLYVKLTRSVVFLVTSFLTSERVFLMTAKVLGTWLKILQILNFVDAFIK